MSPGKWEPVFESEVDVREPEDLHCRRTNIRYIPEFASPEARMRYELYHFLNYWDDFRLLVMEGVRLRDFGVLKK